MTNVKYLIKANCEGDEGYLTIYRDDEGFICGIDLEDALRADKYDSESDALAELYYLRDKHKLYYNDFIEEKFKIVRVTYTVEAEEV